MTSDTKPPGGWPGAPGVPENPEQERYHWMLADGADEPVALLWWPEAEKWFLPRLIGPATNIPAARMAADGWRYLGPALLPAEVAAREAAAREEGRLSATLDAPTQPLDDPQWDATDAAHPAWWRGNDHGVAAVVQIINDTLDGKAPGTYGSADLTSAIRRVAKAREAGMRRARTIAENVCDDVKRRTETPRKRAREDGHLAEECHQDGKWHGAHECQEEIAAAILAAIEKKETTT